MRRWATSSPRGGQATTSTERGCSLAAERSQRRARLDTFALVQTGILLTSARA